MQQTLSVNEAEPVIESAVRRRKDPGQLIGGLLARQAGLREQDIERILAYATKKRMRFGTAAIKLGLVSRQDLDHALAAQFDYPYLEKGAGGYSPRLVAAYDPFSAKGNALRILRSELQRLWFSQGHNALAILGPGGREGCSHVAANLAVMFSQMGESTVLVDADLKDPSQHKLFGISNDAGLSSALVGRAPVEAVVRRLPLFRDLSLVTSGISPPNLYDLLYRAELARIVDELSARYGVVLFDAPPFIERMGAENVAQKCGGALMVVRRHQTRLSDARQAVRELNECGVTITGTTITQF